MFEALELDRRLRLGLRELAFTRPTTVQERVVPAALSDAGFEFQFPDLESALADLLGGEFAPGAPGG